MAEMPVVLDLRPLAARDRHPAVIALFTSLDPGKSFELRNDHDPLPLHLYFKAVYQDQFLWQPVEEGPAQWRVSVTRL
jgi:uncharacterized protein (DUF2249 family)